MLFASTLIVLSQENKTIAYKASYCKLVFFEVGSGQDVSDEVDSIIGSKSCIAYGNFIKARRACNLQKTAVVVSSMLIGVPTLFFAISQDEETYVKQLPLVASGVALVFISLPVTRLTKKHAKNATEDYNAWINRTGYIKTSFSIGVASRGLGVQLNF